VITLSCKTFKWVLPLVWLLMLLPSIAQSDVEKIPDYEDGFTFKKGGLYAKDPNIWVYTKSFAQRFGMPEKWVDDKLEGIEAAAWRVEAGQTSCGWARQEQACKIDPRCVLDIYIDTNKHKLPWAPDSRELDYDAGYTSLWILRPQGSEERRSRTSSISRSKFAQKSPFADPETGEEAFYVYWSKDELSVGSAYFMNYEKQGYSSLSVISLEYGCYFLQKDGRPTFFDLQTRRSEQGKSHKFKSFHKAILPGSFTKRIGQRGEEVSQQAHEFYKGIWESR